MNKVILQGEIVWELEGERPSFVMEVPLDDSSTTVKVSLPLKMKVEIVGTARRGQNGDVRIVVDEMKVLGPTGGATASWPRHEDHRHVRADELPDSDPVLPS